MTVKLYRGQSRFGGDADHGLALFVYEHAHFKNRLRELIDYLARILRRNVARAGPVEIKAECIGARVHRSERIFETGNTANLNQGHVLKSRSAASGSRARINDSPIKNP